MRAPARFVALLLALVVTATGCASTTDRLEVVATAYPLFEAAATTGGDRVHAVNLLPLDPFGPLTARQADQLRSADLAVVLGAGAQPEVESVLAARTGPTLRILEVVRSRPAAEGQVVSGSLDPYVWLDPQNMARTSDEVRRSLTALDPENHARYRKNARGLMRWLSTFDRLTARTLRTCERSTVLSTGASFGHLTDRHGLMQQQTKGEHPAIAAAADASGSTTVFLPALPALDDAEVLLVEHGVRAAVLDPLAAQTDQARRGGATYGSVMAANLDALRAGLGCAELTAK